MKMLMAMTGLVLASTAFAQTWGANDGKVTLVGCYGKQDGVYCDFNYILTEKQTENLQWSTSSFGISKQDGTSKSSDAVSFAGGEFSNIYTYTATKEITANVPVKLQVYFNIPSSISSLRAVSIDGVKFDNIPVRPYGSVSTTPTELPAGSNVKGFAISLSNCQLQGQNYVCVATLTPSK
jgi:hypothetical protein